MAFHIKFLSSELFAFRVPLILARDIAAPEFGTPLVRLVSPTLSSSLYFAVVAEGAAEATLTTTACHQFLEESVRISEVVKGIWNLGFLKCFVDSNSTPSQSPLKAVFAPQVIIYLILAALSSASNTRTTTIFLFRRCPESFHIESQISRRLFTPCLFTPSSCMPPSVASRENLIKPLRTLAI